MQNNKLTLLIHSCDKFSDLWPAHISLLNKNWPDRSIHTVILTDNPRDDKFEGVEILSAGAGKEITERIRYALPLIDTEYILVTLDDYFPIHTISSERINRLIDIMDRCGYDYIRLFKEPNCPKKDTEDKDVYTFTLDGDYRVNLYVGIWRKSFMEATLGNKELNAWQYEVTLTDRAKMVNGKCAVSLGNEFPILDVVRKGEILRKAHKYLKKHDLYHGDRPIRPVSAEVKLWIRTQGAKIVVNLPKPLRNTIRKFCVKLGMRSFQSNKSEYLS